jgi:hypothetical protein
MDPFLATLPNDPIYRDCDVQVGVESVENWRIRGGERGWKHDPYTLAVYLSARYIASLLVYKYAPDGSFQRYYHSEGFGGTPQQAVDDAVTGLRSK